MSNQRPCAKCKGTGAREQHLPTASNRPDVLQDVDNPEAGGTPPECPLCQGTCEWLGRLGRCDHFRCRACGINVDRQYPEVVDTAPCSYCNGGGAFAEPDYAAIVRTLIVRQKGRRRFRRSSPTERGSLAGGRAYYVWRLVRFHGGADVTLPMTASCIIAGDPFQPELDVLVDHLSRRVFGTDMAGASRWASALRGTSAPAGLPPSAYPGGPVQDGHKPIFEALELI